MDVRLIRANIALFLGKRTETRRLLKDYAAERGEEAKQSPMVMWLDAQSQTHQSDRIKKLSALVEAVEEGNPYRRLAHEYLEQEKKYEGILRPEQRNFKVPPSLFGVPLGRALALLVVGGVLTFVLLSALNAFGGGQPVEVVNVTDGAPTLEANVTPAAGATSGAVVPTVAANATESVELPPDRSQVVAPDQYTVRYDSGTLQITAFEYGSQRVIDIEQIQYIEPVDGAVFYALKLRFECGRGVCYNPPEARLAVILNDGTEILPKQNSAIAGEEVLVAKAAGQFTDGWVVFEIPAAVPVDQLKASPLVSSGPTPQPLLIDAPTQ